MVPAAKKDMTTGVLVDRHLDPTIDDAGSAYTPSDVCILG